MIMPPIIRRPIPSGTDEPAFPRCRESPWWSPFLRRRLPNGICFAAEYTSYTRQFYDYARAKMWVGHTTSSTRHHRPLRPSPPCSLVLPVVPSVVVVGVQDREGIEEQPSKRRLQRSSQGLRALLREASTEWDFPRGVQDALARRSPGQHSKDKGEAKAYQVRQVLAAINKKEAM